MGPQENQANARIKASPRLLLIVLLAVSIPLLLVLEQRLLPRPDDSNDQFLEGQRSVLRPDYQEVINSVESAPRYLIEVDVDPDNSSYQGEVEILFEHKGEECLPEVGLMLYANAASIYGGSLEVSQVIMDGQNIEFQLLNPTNLKVPLSECLPPGSSLALQASFAGTLPATGEAGYGILSANQRGLALSGWYPMLSLPVHGVEDKEIPVVGDALHAEISLIEAVVTAPADYRLITTGEAEIQATGERVEWRVISGPARELTILLLDDPQPDTQQVDGVEIRFFPSEASSGLSGQQPIEMAATIFEHYQASFGPYPYRQLDIVEWPVSIGGYEFSGLIFMDEGMRAAGNEVDFEFLLAHELAHQWWYLLVGNDQVNEPWLDEALANYSVLRYLETKEGDQAAALLQRWRQRYGQRQPGDPPVDSPATEFAGWDSYQRTVYIHGALFLDALEEQLGSEAINEFLVDHVQRHRFGMTSTSEFVAMAQNSADENLTNFFEVRFSQGALSTVEP